jgi:hypothetical protein
MISLAWRFFFPLPEGLRGLLLPHPSPTEPELRPYEKKEFRRLTFCPLRLEVIHRLVHVKVIVPQALHDGVVRKWGLQVGKEGFGDR